MKNVIVDLRIPKKCASTLVALGYEPIFMPPFPALPKPVSAHPDMLMFFADKKVICHKNYLAIAKNEFNKISKAGYEIITTDEDISDEYPRDILFNALPLAGRIYGKHSALSRLIGEYIDRCGLVRREVRQGYAKCSVCPIGDSAAITSDPSLRVAMSADGIDVLLISHGAISLTGYDTGFIGGCSGSDKNNVFFSGNVATHPDAKDIIDFCEKHGKCVVSLSDEPLYDIGSMFFI